MKKLLFAMALAQLCGLQLVAQESSVKILLDEEERFRFDSIQLRFINTGHHVMIGDSTGMDNAANSLSIENTFVGHRAGSTNQGDWNTFLGARAGENHVEGDDNLFLGAGAGRYDSSGNYNTYVGTAAGRNSKAGQFNTYIGWCAGVFDSSGRNNVFIGNETGRENTGRLNAFVGTNAGYRNSSGSQNTFLGTSSGGYNTTGNFNTYIGRRAGMKNETGSGNVFLGYYAGFKEMGSNKLYVANDSTLTPLIYGEFDTPKIRFNAKWVETGFNGNVFIGDSAGSMHQTGEDNIFIGTRAGIYDSDGQSNVFIGQNSGQFNTTGKLNTFVGNGAGWSNTSGLRNTFMGLSAGPNNTSGSYNTYIGRTAGWLNQTGDSNVFIGNMAGWYEMGSSKLYISNSETSEPLIYGDFADKKLKFHADSVWATGEIRADERFNVGGLPGITDTLNTVTSISFTQNKLKYRTSIITGGIITFMSLESEWSDTIEEYLIPCNAIGLMGKFNGGTDDLPMTRTLYNPYLWMLSVKFTIEDDLTEPADSIVEVKFRDNASWTVNWGSTDFPTGNGYQDGPYIPVPLCDYQDTTYYCIQFNCLTGEYSFEELTGLCGDPIIDIRDGKRYATVLIGDQCWMAQDLNVGTRIDGGTDQTDNGTVEKYCYDNLEYNCTKWGGLYQWPELMQYVTTPGFQGICPAGFHVPTDDECKVLEGNVDSQYGPGSTEWDKTEFRGFDAGYNLKSTSGWSDGENGSDEFGFHALPGGYYSVQGNGFFDGGHIHSFCTSIFDVTTNMAWVRNTWGPSNQINRHTNSTVDGKSVRCLKD